MSYDWNGDTLHRGDAEVVTDEGTPFILSSLKLLRELQDEVRQSGVYIIVCAYLSPVSCPLER